MPDPQASRASLNKAAKGSKRRGTSAHEVYVEAPSLPNLPRQREWLGFYGSVVYRKDTTLSR